VLTDYLNFLIEFAQKPRKTLAPYQGRGKINYRLLLYVGLSVLLSVAISLVATRIGIVDDPSSIVAFLRSFDYSWLPFVMILLILFAALIIHLAAKLYTSFKPVIPGALDAHLGGCLQDSINAAFAFSAFFIPLVTFVILLLLGLANQDPDLVTNSVSTIVGFAIALAVLIYFPAALAATHPQTRPIHAFLALSAAMVVIYLVLELITVLIG
jgi:hypothetical protein